MGEVLDDHDRVVEHEPDRSGDAAQRHEIQRLVTERASEQRQPDAGGQDDQRGPAQLPAAEEEDDENHRQHGADDQAVAHARDGIAHQVRLVVEDLDARVARQHGAMLVEPAPRLPGHVDRARRRLPQHVHEHRLAGLGGVARELRRLLERDPSQGPEPSRSSVGHRDRNVGQRFQIGRARIGQTEIELAVRLEQPHRLQRAGLRERVRDALGVQAMRLERRWIERDARLELTPALDHDLGHSGQPRQLRLDLERGDVAELGESMAGRHERESQHREQRWIHEAGVDRGPRRHRVAHRGDLGLHALQGEIHVAAPAAIQVDLRRAAARDRAHLEQPRHAAQGGLQRPRHLAQHLVAGALPALRDHLDAWKRHLGEDRRGQPQTEGVPDDREREEAAEDRAALPVHPLEEAVHAIGFTRVLSGRPR